MKKIFNLLLLAFIGLICIILSNCAINQDEPVAQKNQELPEVKRMPGVYPDTLRLFDIISKYPSTNWGDLDSYYRNDIPRYHSGKDYTDNLKKHAIAQLVYTFDLINVADKKTIEYYIQEQMSVPIVDTDIFIKCLEGLVGYWSDERIKSTALSEYDRLINYVTNNMKDPSTVLQKYKSKFDKLKDFGEKYPNN